MLFRSHPSTASRIRHVKSVKQKHGNIHVSLVNQLSNFVSIAILIIITGTTWNYVKNIEYLYINKTGLQINFDKYGDMFTNYIQSIKQEIDRAF